MKETFKLNEEQKSLLETYVDQIKELKIKIDKQNEKIENDLLPITEHEDIMNQELANLEKTYSEQVEILSTKNHEL